MNGNQQRITRNGIKLLIVLISLSFFACAPKYITPQINYATYQEVRQSEPDCSEIITAIRYSKDRPDDLVLEGFHCKDLMREHWVDAYQVLEIKLQTLNEEGA